MALPTDRDKPSVPIRRPDMVNPSNANSQIAASVGNFAENLANIMYGKIQRTREREGKIDGLTAGSRRDEHGQLIAPDYTDIDPDTFYGAAYMLSSGEIYSNGVKIDSRNKLGEIAEKHPYDVEKFDAEWMAYRDATEENIPEQLLPSLRLSMDDMYGSTRLGVIAQQNQFAQKLMVDQHNVRMDGILQTAIEHMEAGSPPEIIDRQIAEARTEISNMAAAGLLTNPEQSIAAFENEVYGATAAISVRKALIRGDVNGAFDQLEKISTDKNIPEDQRAVMLVKAQQEVNNWSSRENARLGYNNAQKALMHGQNELILLKRMYQDGEQIEDGEIWNALDRGRISPSFAISAIKANASRTAARTEELQTIFGAKALAKYNDEGTPIPELMLRQMSVSDQAKYITAFSKKQADRVQGLKDINYSQTLVEVKRNPQEFNLAGIVAFASEGFRKERFTASQAQQIVSNWATAYESVTGKAVDLSEAYRLISEGKDMPSKIANSLNSALSPHNPEHWGAIVGAAHQSGVLLPVAKDFIQNLGQGRGDAERLKMFETLNSTLSGQRVLMDALGSGYVPMEEAVRDARALGTEQAVKNYVQKMDQAVDKSAASRLVSTRFQEGELEDLRAIRRHVQDRMERHQGTFDLLAAKWGWGDKTLADFAERLRRRGINFDDIAINDHIASEIGVVARRMAGDPAYKAASKEKILDLASMETLAKYTPVPSEMSPGGYYWDKDSIVQLANVDSPVPAQWENHRANNGYEFYAKDQQAQLELMNVNPPPGYASWTEVPLDFHFVGKNEAGRNNFIVRYYNDATGEYVPLIYRDKENNPKIMTYAWQYEGSIYNAMDKLALKPADSIFGKNGSFTRWVAGMEPNWTGVKSVPEMRLNELQITLKNRKLSEQHRMTFDFSPSIAKWATEDSVYRQELEAAREEATWLNR